MARTIHAVTNHCIDALNRMYNYAHSVSNPLYQRPSPLNQSRPDKFSPNPSCRAPAWPVALPPAAAPSPSAAQLRVQQHLRACCATFVLKARAWRPHGPACVIGASVLDALASPPAPFGARAPSSSDTHNNDPTPSQRHTRTASDAYAAATQQLHADMWESVPLPFVSSFSSEPTPVVPLVASRVALPSSLCIVPLARVLPPDLAAAYAHDASPALLRPLRQVCALDQAAPLRAPRVAGTRREYVRLVGRLVQQGMVGFTGAPLAVNGVFAVGKDADSDRLIIDAQPANRLFVDSPGVSLPNPSHLVQLQVPRGQRMFVGKSDLSNFYHHLGLPSWLRPYFALPPLTPQELAQCGAPSDAAYPMCLTLPMGFSHAVFLAQSVHQHVLYSARALDPRDSLLHLLSPTVTHDRAVHGIVIDDLFLFSLDQQRAQQSFDAVLAAYRAAGFVVKDSKVVAPTSAPVKVIGFDIDGAAATVSLPEESQQQLVRTTLAVLARGVVTGGTLSYLLGKWTWCMLLRRPSLAALQQSYRYAQLARGRRFTLWPSVRRELRTLLALLPLLHARLDTPCFHRAIASDASELAAGVVTTPLTPDLQHSFWPLCSSRHHATVQAQLNTDRVRTALGSALAANLSLDNDTQRVLSLSQTFDSFYGAVSAAPWTTVVSTPWRDEEHINALELRAALLAVHWALSFPSALCRRVYLLLDSSVAFFTLWKGRSSSPQLLMVLRKVSAMLLAGGLTLLPGWVPSAVNPADAPSRDTGGPPQGSSEQ